MVTRGTIGYGRLYNYKWLRRGSRRALIAVHGYSLIRACDVVIHVKRICIFIAIKLVD